MSLLKKYFEKKEEKERDSAVIAHLAALDHLNKTNPKIAASILNQLKDERSYLKMIASENFSSLAVQLSMGNWLTDKYAEGYPHHRFYAGCQNVDAIEQDAEETIKAIFQADEAYIQPHSGIDANLVALWSYLFYKFQFPALEKLNKKKVDDLTQVEHEEIRQQMINQKMLGMAIDAGGHLTHGYGYNIFSKMIHAIPYGVSKKTELIDYAEIAKLAKKEKPTILLAGYSAYPRRINFAKMKEIADDVGAALFVDMAHFAGLVAGKEFKGDEDPVPFADFVTSTTHKTLRGPRGGFVLAKKEYGEVLKKGCPIVLGGPLPHVMAAKAIAFREAKKPSFQLYAKKVVENARALAESLKENGCRLTTDGTDNHMVIVDVSPFGLTGRQVEKILRQALITVNRNMIPFDQNGAWYTSGIRIGTSATTTLGMGIFEMKKIGKLIAVILSHIVSDVVDENGQKSKAKASIDPQILARAKKEVQEILFQYPLYPEIPFDLEEFETSETNPVYQK